MGITQFKFTSSQDEYIIVIEDDKIEEEEGLFGTSKPNTDDYHIDNQIDGSDQIQNIPGHQENLKA
jgi:hypothetical protein